MGGAGNLSAPVGNLPAGMAASAAMKPASLNSLGPE